MKKKLVRIFSISGSLIAFHVGSGFASGQEVLQFYTAFGPTGGLLVCLLAFALFVTFSSCVMEYGRRSPQLSVHQQYKKLGGNWIGNFFYYLTPVLMLLVLCVTIAGGGAALNTLFGIPVLWGRVWMSIPVLLTVLLGLKWITALAGSIGPIIILCALCLGGFGILQGSSGALWERLPHTSANWVVSGISYACFGTITQIPFLLTVGKELDDTKESVTIAVLGNGGYMLTGAVMHLGLWRSLPQVWGEQLPALRLAREISSLAGWFYGIILLFSIYTTAVPMLWSVARTVQADEKGWFYRGSSLVLILLACFGAWLPFDRLLGILYPYIGYVSALFFAVMLIRARSSSPAACIKTGHKSERAA